MFGLFGFDPSGMSDEELLAKTTEIQARLVWASRFGGGDMVTALQSYLRAFEFEYNERTLRMVQKQRDAAFPSIIESDPDLAAQHREEEPDTKNKIRPQNKPRVSVTRTRTPVISKDIEDLSFDDTPKDKE